MLYVEGKADRLLALRLTGLPGREVQPVGDRAEVLARLDGEVESLAMLDEDPEDPVPVELSRKQLVSDFTDSRLQVYLDRRRGNRAIVICPRLEEWIAQAADQAGLKLSEPRYNLPENPVSLHRVINRDPRKLDRLVTDLLSAQSPRILKLQELLTS